MQYFKKGLTNNYNNSILLGNQAQSIYRSKNGSRYWGGSAHEPIGKNAKIPSHGLNGYSFIIIPFAARYEDEQWADNPQFRDPSLALQVTTDSTSVASEDYQEFFHEASGNYHDMNPSLLFSSITQV